MPRVLSVANVRRVAAGVLACTLVPSRAEAHLVTTGLGPIYDGISHVFLSPDDLVPIVAIALLAGLNGPAVGRRALFALTAAWLAGGMAGVLVGQPTCLPRSRPHRSS
jgi:hydrogenase/urease accessory protein HupE